MRRLLTQAGATGLLLLAPAAASAGVEDSYCSPSGDYCESVLKEKGVRYLHFATFSLRGEMKVCVTPPHGERTCRMRRLREFRTGFFRVRTRWAKSFPRAGKGRYRVQFSQGDFRAPSLYFRVG